MRDCKYYNNFTSTFCVFYMCTAVEEPEDDNFESNSIHIPARTFENIASNTTGVVFSFYSDNTLFPIRLNHQTESENTIAIGSGILSAALAGHEIEGLVEPINITLSIIITVSL